ncbi:MAG: LpqN/LpqT family lipoprotein [Mycobacterium sp.]
MKHLIAATITVALSLALIGCGSDIKSSNKTSTSTSTSTLTSTSTSSVTSTAPAAGAKYTIADYVRDNHITETPVHRGDPGSPTIDLPLPAGWKVSDSINTSYGGIVLDQPANPSNPPSISSLVSKLTGDVDPAKIIEYAPGELQNLPGFEGSNGKASTLGGFQAWQLGGTYQKDGTTRVVAQKTVVIPSQGAVFVLQLNANRLERDQVPLMDATRVIDDQTTITT